MSDESRSCPVWLVMPKADAAALMRGQGARAVTRDVLAGAAVRRGEERTGEVAGGAR